MSLYGGIKFAAPETVSVPVEAPTKQKEKEPSGKSAPVFLTGHVADRPAGPSSITTSAPKPANKVAAGYSAALKFAPRIKQPKPAQPSRPIGNYTSASVVERQPDIRPIGAGSVSAASTNISGDDLVLGADGRPLARAPAMTLGAEGKGKGIKRDREEEKKRKKKKKVRACHDGYVASLR